MACCRLGAPGACGETEAALRARACECGSGLPEGTLLAAAAGLEACDGPHEEAEPEEDARARVLDPFCKPRRSHQRLVSPDVEGGSWGLADHPGHRGGHGGGGGSGERPPQRGSGGHGKPGN